jgi:hypothetical protein
MPTNNSGGIGKLLEFFKISLKMPGAILQPQPPPRDRLVSRGANSGLIVSREFMMWLSLRVA